MNRAHYIVFHPDYARELVTVRATVLEGSKLNTSWIGEIYVDAIGNGNEDPFVFHDPWLYSYCHASQLRRNQRSDNFVQEGSIIIFASGDKANEGALSIDTLFVIGKVQKWRSYNEPVLPAKFSIHHNNKNSELWKRHFRFPFEGNHGSVSHTYEAEQWELGKKAYSFLPLSKDGGKTTIPFDNIGTGLRNKIAGKVKGKYPVLMSEVEANGLINIIEAETSIKVLKNIAIPSLITATTKAKHKAC